MGTDKAWRRALRGHYCLSSPLQVTWTSHCAGPVLSTYPLTADKYSLVTICTMLRPAWMYLGVLSCTISLGNPNKQFPIESITASILTVKETEAQGYWAVCPGLHELVMRLLGRRKVSGRMCPGFSGIPIHWASPPLKEQIQIKRLRLCILDSPSSGLYSGYGRLLLNSH